MDQVTLGNTGLRVSPLCIGTWQLAGPVAFDGKPDGHPDPGKKNVLRMMGQLRDQGINFIDTAEQYGAGEAERRVGEAIHGNRDAWVVSTKFGYRVGPNQTRVDDSSPATILASVEGSLQRLRTDHIDIYLYHCPPRAEDLPEAKRILERARAEGKIRFFGISTGDLSLAQLLAESGILDVLQYPTSLLAPQDAMHDFAHQQGVGTQVRGIMAQGRLSGKYFATTPVFAADDNRSQRMKDERYERFAVLQEVIPNGFTMSQVAIRWALDQPGHHSICLGAKSLDDYQAAIAAVDLPPLEAETLEAISDQCCRVCHD